MARALGVVRAGHAVAIAQVGVKIVEQDVPDMAGPVDLWIQGNLGAGILGAGFKQHQGDTLRVPGEHGEIDPFRLKE